MLIASGATTVVYALTSRVAHGPTAVLVPVGAMAVMTGLAALTLFLWGVGGIWLMIIAGAILSRIVWVTMRPRRGLGVALLVVTNGLTFVLIVLMLIWSSTGFPEPGVD